MMAEQSSKPSSEPPFLLLSSSGTRALRKAAAQLGWPPFASGRGRWTHTRRLPPWVKRTVPLTRLNQSWLTRTPACAGRDLPLSQEPFPRGNDIDGTGVGLDTVLVEAILHAGEATLRQVAVEHPFQECLRLGRERRSFQAAFCDDSAARAAMLSMAFSRYKLLKIFEKLARRLLKSF